MMLRRHLITLAAAGLGLLSGCATPIATAYDDSSVNTPVHYVVSNAIAGAEMAVFNPIIYYPLELIGAADFGLIWSEQPESDDTAPEPVLREGFFHEPEQQEEAAMQDPGMEETESEKNGAENPVGEDGSPPAGEAESS